MDYKRWREGFFGGNPTQSAEDAAMKTPLAFWAVTDHPEQETWFPK